MILLLLRVGYTYLEYTAHSSQTQHDYTLYHYQILCIHSTPFLSFLGDSNSICRKFHVASFHVEQSKLLVLDTNGPHPYKLYKQQLLVYIKKDNMNQINNFPLN